MYKYIFITTLTLFFIACGSGATDNGAQTVAQIASQTNKKLTPQIRQMLIASANTIIQSKLAEDSMQLLDFSLSLKAQGILAIGADANKTTFNIYRFNANPIRYEKTFTDVALPSASIITSISPLKNGDFKIVTFHQNNTSTHTFNYFDGHLKDEKMPITSDAVKTFVEQDGMVFLEKKYSLHGGGILAIASTNTGTNYKVYRFDAATLAHEHTFANVPINPHSTIQSITALEGGRFKISMLEESSHKSATINYFTGELRYENSPFADVAQHIKEEVSKDDLTLLTYQYSLQRGGILAVATDTSKTHYNFYRFDATSLILEKVYHDVAMRRGDTITEILPQANGKFKLKTSFYGLSDEATFDYFTGAFSY